MLVGLHHHVALSYAWMFSLDGEPNLIIILFAIFFSSGAGSITSHIGHCTRTLHQTLPRCHSTEVDFYRDSMVLHSFMGNFCASNGFLPSPVTFRSHCNSSFSQTRQLDGDSSWFGEYRCCSCCSNVGMDTSANAISASGHGRTILLIRPRCFRSRPLECASFGWIERAGWAVQCAHCCDSPRSLCCPVGFGGVWRSNSGTCNCSDLFRDTSCIIR
mmetsp:Transcript_98257/g.155412  ORF Transcript_98257/g.155412 Transcript_98257/m.155412 type:complete len:216 (+) Transcript_98257:986-1633(+)